MVDELIPFGKYKGQPIETLAQDKSYADWVVAQSDIKRKYPDIHLYILNNFRRPDDTPEHNELQVKFLAQEYSLKLAYFLKPDLFFWNSEQINKELRKRLGESSAHNDVIKSKLKENKKTKLLKISNPTLEEGYDVSYSVRYGMFFSFEYEMPNKDTTSGFELNKSNFVNILVEIKPTIGDDFPSVLRQMKASMPVRYEDYMRHKFHCLLVRDYTGEGASKEQFIQFFQSQNYRVIFTSDIESLRLPFIEDEFKLSITE